MAEILNRDADETLTLFKQALQKRRAYVKRRIDELKANEEEQKKKRGSRGRPSFNSKMNYMSRSGMLSELTTITWILKEIESGTVHPGELYNVEDDPQV